MTDTLYQKFYVVQVDATWGSSNIAAMAVV